MRGITLSREQLDYARARIRQAGLADQCSFVYQDYREEERQYDGIVSIEMFEAVGETYWPVYFATPAWRRVRSKSTFPSASRAR